MFCYPRAARISVLLLVLVIIVVLFCNLIFCPVACPFSIAPRIASADAGIVAGIGVVATPGAFLAQQVGALPWLSSPSARGH